MDIKTTKEKIGKESILNRLQKLTNEKRRMPCTHNEKLRLIKYGLLENCCNICGIVEWNGKPISLHLDHIDGDATNNLLSNLRILCPNCHSQTKTYCGKNTKRKYKKPTCKDCGKPTTHTSAIRCVECYQAFRRTTGLHCKTKIEWPEDEKFKEMVLNRKNMETLAKSLGVSSNAIRKRCRKLNIDYHAVALD